MAGSSRSFDVDGRRYDESALMSRDEELCITGSKQAGNTSCCCESPSTAVKLLIHLPFDCNGRTLGFFDHLDRCLPGRAVVKLNYTGSVLILHRRFPINAHHVTYIQKGSIIRRRSRHGLCAFRSASSNGRVRPRQIPNIDSTSSSTRPSVHLSRGNRQGRRHQWSSNFDSFAGDPIPDSSGRGKAFRR